MPYHYEALVEPTLSTLFQQSFAQALEERAFKGVLEVAPPGGPHLWEFGRERDLVSLSITGGREGKERLVIESETLDLRDLVLEAVQRVATRFALAFLAPLSTLERAKMENQIRACLAGLTAD